VERRPGPWLDPHSDRRDTRARPDEPATGPGAGGNLPPWSSLGLGPAPSPGFERDWEPTEGDLAETADLPDRPASRLGRGARILIPVCLGLVLIAGAVGLVWFDVIGGSNTPTPTHPAVAGLGGELETRSAGTPQASPHTGKPTAVPARAARATSQATTAPATSNPTSTQAPTSIDVATPAPKVLLAVGKGDAGGLSGDDLGAQLREALANQLPGRQIDVVGESRSDEASIIVAAAEPAPAFDARVVAIAPLALVTSPRLPLTGVDGDQANQLLTGTIADWRDVGAAPGLAVEPLALKGAVPEGMNPVATYKDYEALVAGFAKHPGGVALVPLDAVDFRVNVLAVDGVDPLRGIGNVLGYPFGARLYVGVRSDRASDLKPALDAALAAIGLPQQAPAVASLGFAGDVVPGRNANQHFGAPDDGTHSFVDVANELAAYDLTVANLEGVLSASADASATGFATPFAAAPSLTDGLKLAGIDAVSLANDHAVSSGTQGLTDTVAALRESGITPIGAGENLEAARAPFLAVVDGVKVAIIAVDGVGANPDGSSPGGTEGAATADGPGINPLALSRLRTDIKAAGTEADVVIVYLHIGDEDQETTPASAIEAAHAAIDAGATLVVATHPRVVGGMEIYKGQPIVYSLGSLVDDQMQSVQTRQGAILEVTLRGATIVGLRFHGVEIQDFNQPRPMTDAEEAALLDRIWRLSDRLAGKG
jgi:poly-gamma-glutamate capsule biosynthesis protein CapA/YwtB (metallophosphatase superfamily)